MLRKLAALSLVLAGCAPRLSVDNQGYCEKGDSSGDCIFLTPEKDGDSKTIGRVSVKSRPSASAFVRRDGRRKYTLHRDGKQVGTLVFPADSETWIDVTLTDGEPYEKSMRINGPGGLFE